MLHNYFFSMRWESPNAAQEQTNFKMSLTTAQWASGSFDEKPQFNVSNPGKTHHFCVKFRSIKSGNPYTKWPKNGSHIS